jgi:hypothetical protein
MRYFSTPQPQRGYYIKNSSGIRKDTLQIFYSIEYDSVADKKYRDTLLVRGKDFERVSAFLQSKVDSLFNFGFYHIYKNIVEQDFLNGLIVRTGRKNIIFNNHLTSRPLFGEFFTKVDSAWTSSSLPKGSFLVIDFKFGKDEYTVYGSPTISSYILADVNVINNGVVMYSRVWATLPFYNMKGEQLDFANSRNIRWFTEENLSRLAAAIRKDLQRKLMR